MNNTLIQKLGKLLDEAVVRRSPIKQLSDQYTFSEKEAYDIQAATIQQRISRGEKMVGVKMGFTSKAKMKQMGVHDLIWGILTDEMIINNNGEIRLTDFIHPRAEPEICFRVSKAINRHIQKDELLEYFDGVAPAIEIIDSRYENFKFSLGDVIADNCSSSGFVIGSWSDPAESIEDLSIDLLFDQEVVHKGNSDAILGNPWDSAIAASRLISQYSLEIPEGSYILAGAATPAAYLKPGIQVQAIVEKLGSVTFHVLD